MRWLSVHLRVVQVVRSVQHGTTIYPALARLDSVSIYVHKITRVGVAALPTARSMLVFIVNVRSVSVTLTHRVL